MLYHVPDPDRALREAHRVARPGARAVASANHAAVLPRVTGMVSEELERRGVGTPDYVQRINSDDLPDRMAAVFGQVEAARQDNALVFPEPEPVVRYAVSILGLYGLPSHAEGYGEVVEALDLRVRAWFTEHGGPWRDPKGHTVCAGVR